MEWAVDFAPPLVREDVHLVRETLEAKVKAEAGQYGEAARILWELLVQLRHDKNRQWECMTMVHMGMVYRALRWSIAVSLFEDALDLADAIDFGRAKMMALIQLGEMKCHWGQFDESLELLGRAHEYREEDDLPSLRLIMLDKVMAYEGLDQLERCREILEEVIVLDRQMDWPDLDEDVAHLERITQSIKNG